MRLVLDQGLPVSAASILRTTGWDVVHASEASIARRVPFGVFRYASPMSSTHDQQPIFRTVGRRKSRNGQPLSGNDRARMTEMARYRTRAPKGVFRYSSHEEMEADRLKWLVDAMVEKARAR